MGLVDQLGLSYPPRGPARRTVGRLAGTRPAATILARALPVMDRLALGLTGGKLSSAQALAGIPVLSLTTTGARTGQSHSRYVIGVPVENDLALIGTNFGQASHPAWAHNLLAQPRARVEFRGVAVEVWARALDGAERDGVWQAASTLYAGFVMYRARLEREPLVFRLEAASPP